MFIIHSTVHCQRSSSGALPKQNSTMWLACWPGLGICRVANVAFRAFKPLQVTELRSPVQHGETGTALFGHLVLARSYTRNLTWFSSERGIVAFK